MKKYFTLCLFTFAFLICTQSNFAQEKFNANEIAIKKTEQLKTIMDLTNDQQKSLIDLYESTEDIKHKIAAQTRDGVVSLKRLKAIEDKVEFKTKEILNEKQFGIYQDYKKKQSIQKF